MAGKKSVKKPKNEYRFFEDVRTSKSLGLKKKELTPAQKRNAENAKIRAKKKREAEEAAKK